MSFLVMGAGKPVGGRRLICSILLLTRCHIRMNIYFIYRLCHCFYLQQHQGVLGGLGMETTISIGIASVARFNRTALKIDIPLIMYVLTLPPSTAAWARPGPLRGHVKSDEDPNTSRNHQCVTSSGMAYT